MTVNRTFSTAFCRVLFCGLFDETLDRGEQHFTASSDFILEDILLKDDYEVIRVFVDGLLSRTSPSVEVLKQY